MLFGELLHHQVDLFDKFGVQRRGRLVEQHHLGLHRQRPRDGDALLLSARQARRVLVDLFGKSDLGQLFLGQFVGLFLGQVFEHARRQRDVAAHGQMREQVEMLEHHADVLAHLIDMGLVLAKGQLAVDLDILQPDLSRGQRVQLVDRTQQG